MKLTILADTYLKAFPEQSSELLKSPIPDQAVPVLQGKVLEIDDHFPWKGEAGVGGDHWLVQLAGPMPGHQAIRWFIFGQHCMIEGCEIGNDPRDSPVTPRPVSEMISLPGIPEKVWVNAPVFEGSKFTWSEMTKAGKRIPVDQAVTGRIVNLCQYLTELRQQLGGRPMHINSAYRDPITNRAVGGASRSRHMVGDAVDFYIEGEDVVDTFMRLKSIHKTGGLAVGNGFVHIDMRPGGPVRWRYPGGPNVDLW